jgi:fatty acid desaturase
MSFSWPIFWPFIVKNPLRFEHNSHHVKIGDTEFDYEVAGFAPLIRYSGNVEHTFLHQYQHKLAFFLYPFYANIITTLGAYHSGYWEKHNRADLSEQAISLLQTALYFIIIPSLIKGSVTWYLLLYLVYQCVLFYGIYIGAAINHFVPSIMKAIPKEHENKCAYYVCHNTTNFSVNSSLWFWYTGGFNIQIEHHLIPFIPVENLHKMVPIVKELCKKHNYPYHEYQNFRELWNDHYSYLFELSQKKNGEGVIKEMQNKNAYQAR